MMGNCHPRFAIPFMVLVPFLGACGSDSTQAGFAGMFRPDRASPPVHAQPSQPDVNVFAAQRQERPSSRAQQPPILFPKTQFDVMRIVVPIGAVSKSREIWNQVDEQTLPVDQVEHLRKNGLRVGIVNKAGWSALKATLDEIPDRKIMHEPLLIFKSGFPLNLSIDREPRLNTIFFYRRDGTMPGDSWPDSKRYLHIVHSPNPEDFNEVMLAVTPEVRQDKKGIRWELTEQGSRPVTVYRGKVFAELSVFVTVPAGSVLMIGPSPQADNPIIFGGAFLTDETDGKRWETIYFIAPRMVRTTTARK